ncbi:uncharacterized protein JCM6883_006518 [Sporobolomyces salmoneus]|uniref:uncharacterized protein n=1 Tax=Sporobolomyces salmoneus TaxID=183962 RepID=UPI00317138A2
MLNLLARSLLTMAARPLTRTTLPAPSLLRSFSSLSLRPSLPTLPRIEQTQQRSAFGGLQQTRTFKMPSCMRKKSSPVSRNSGAGKTARKHSARRAKRRRQRAKKLN